MVKKLMVLFVFGLYWGITVFFTIPENYLQIKAIRLGKVFSTMFYQRWSFFAPPPQHNDRLYYQFITHNHDTLLYEVLQPVQKLRKKQYLANNDISIIDYVLSNSLNNISDQIRENFGNYKYLHCEGMDEDACFSMFLEGFEKEMYEMNEINTLKNYGIRLNHSKSDRHFYKFKVIYATVPVAKFADRNNPEKVPKEQFVFETKYYDLTHNLWID
ncbi:hypothetical protein AAG747_00135 [Rapidithrix thailandica]|uniref:Uncharacterized protein n=1 Tax=Rapidithrix thailandica TaxID=413964 RepID=A0AAW9S689_9BACT